METDTVPTPDADGPDPQPGVMKAADVQRIATERQYRAAVRDRDLVAEILRLAAAALAQPALR